MKFSLNTLVQVPYLKIMRNALKKETLLGLPKAKLFMEA
jgi:hypothetical protein